MDTLLGRSTFLGGQEDVVEALRQVPSELFFLSSGSKIVELDELASTDFVQIHYRCLGGKGGFGSLLKSFRIHRSNNQLMMRTLEGRRVHDVKEEERLKKWVEKKAAREKEKKQKKEEKYEKLKAGGPKHKFEDIDYLRRRDLVLDDTEDSIEAGLKSMENKPEKVQAKSLDTEESDSSDDEAFLNGFMSVTSKKRKASPQSDEENKKAKVDNEADKPGPSGFKAPKKVTQMKPVKVDKKVETKVEVPEKVKEERKEVNYEPVDLDKVANVEELEALELGHLKHALEARGLKCGGTAKERAVRLFSVKGLDPSEYPKKIVAAKK